jgi:SAM-dependent methyltransferase
MKNPQQFLSKKQTASPYDNRLKIFIEEYKRHKKELGRPVKILDIGCGRNVELKKFADIDDKYYGCDFYETDKVKLDNYVKMDLNEELLNKKFAKQTFDVIFCGEVVEHLFSPDELIDEIKKLMNKDSVLIFSTPNLAYYMNRIMLLFGISPFFLENSSERKLGRKFKFLGQDNITEGHIRVFTFGALKDLFKRKNLKIVRIRATHIWNIPTDILVSKISHSLSPDNVFVLKKQ